MVAGTFAPSFSQKKFQAFLCTFQASLTRSLRSAYHYKNLFLLGKVSIDGANFGQR